MPPRPVHEYAAVIPRDLPSSQARPPEEFPAPGKKGRDLPHPALIRQVRAGVVLGGVNAGSSRTPLRPARRTRPI